MTAFNIVRFRVKPGREQDFVDLHREIGAENFPGAERFVLVDTGGGTYCVLGEWESFDRIVDARPAMVGLLDQFREMLEELSPDLGLTDPVSGHAVVMSERKRAARKRAAGKKRAKAAPKKKAAAKKPAKKAAKKAPAKKKPAKRGRR